MGKAVVYIDKLAKFADGVEATGIALPDNVMYNVTTYGAGAEGSGLALKDILTFTPKEADSYIIRWTNSNTGKYDLIDSKSGNATASLTTDKSDKLPTLKLKAANEAATTIITAELLDNGGNVIATAKTTVTTKQGFDDVQNKSYFAYDHIYYLAGQNYKDKVTGLTEPVISGIGKNLYNPTGDVTRA